MMHYLAMLLKFQKSLSRILRYCTAIFDRAANGLQFNIGFQNYVRCASTGLFGGQ